MPKCRTKTTNSTPGVLSAQQHAAAAALACGRGRADAGRVAGVTRRTVQRWQGRADFAAEVKRLALARDDAMRTARTVAAARLARSRRGSVPTGAASRRDVLEWLRYAQGETDAHPARRR